MSTRLGQPFAATWQGRPPRMSPEDLQIWYRWRPLIQHELITQYFDVGLGEGKAPPPDTPEPYAHMWERNTQKRADALLVTRSGLWIVELRFQANSNAIGRLLQYGLLYNQDPTLGPYTQLILVTNERDADIEDMAKAVNMFYVVV